MPLVVFACGAKGGRSRHKTVLGEKQKLLFYFLNVSGRTKMVSVGVVCAWLEVFEVRVKGC